MPVNFDSDNFQNNDFSLVTDNSGDLVLEHKQTGGQFKFDASADSWVPVQGLDMQGADISDAGSIDGNDVTVDSATVNGTATADALEVDSLSIGGSPMNVIANITGTNQQINETVDISNYDNIGIEIWASNSTLSNPFSVTLDYQDRIDTGGSWEYLEEDNTGTTTDQTIDGPLPLVEASEARAGTTSGDWRFSGNRFRPVLWGRGGSVSLSTKTVEAYGTSGSPNTLILDSNETAEEYNIVVKGLLSV